MEDFVRKVINGDGCVPPQVCRDAFESKFRTAISVEWYARDGNFEAIFYKNQLEHVAVFSPSGLLSEYKLMLQPDHLPVKITDIVKKRGEIMSAVLRNRGNALEYEVIVMDKDMKRSLILFSGQGKILSIKEL
ncbi:MAG: hypothetical protein V2I34_08990 [Bacteroidales bacterium]|jgi:hypothetical protein|nr:hypothetical protein [Bacteroidales bacterium]